jgi:hypothetical protein
MNDDTTIITGPFGRFALGENGLIYFYKVDDMAKTLKSNYKVGVFQQIEEAEAWLLEERGGE